MHKLNSLFFALRNILNKKKKRLTQINKFLKDLTHFCIFHGTKNYQQQQMYAK